MAIFKDKTGRGEINYANGPVQGNDGTILFLNDHNGTQKNIFAQHSNNHVVFHLRGESSGIRDMSDNDFTITESSALTKRVESVTHQTKLRTFEFSGGKTLSFSPQISKSDVQLRVGRNNSPAVGPKMKTILPYSHGGDDNAEFAEGSIGREPMVIISFWLYIESIPDSGSCIFETVNGTSRSMGIVLTPGGEIVFRLYDWGVDSTNMPSNDFQQIKSTKKIPTKTWTHITIFSKGFGSSTRDDNTPDYNTSGLDSHHQEHIASAISGPQAEIFINGSREKNPSESGSTSGEFTGTLAYSSGIEASDLPVVFGTGLGKYDSGTSQFTASANFNGRLAEFCYFYTFGFAQQLLLGSFAAPPFLGDHRSIVARTLMSGRKQPTTGISNISERLLTRELDKNSTHPTVRRSGDQRRLGNHTIKFDDGRAQTLKGTEVHYPTKLVSGDPLILGTKNSRGVIYDGYFDGDLTLAHTASTEAYEMFYTRNDQPVHEPFVENRIYIDSGSSFYQTGTLESVLPGFDRPLRDKEFVEINLKNNQTCQLGADPSGVYTDFTTDRGRLDYMAYWNSAGFFENKPGITFHGATLVPNNAAAQNNILTGSCLGFVTSREVFTCSTSAGFDVSDDQTWAGNLNVSKYPDKYFNSIGNPSNIFSFPDDNRYEATGSNLIDMSDYISEPFLVEKIVYEFEEIDVRLDRTAVSSLSTTGVGYNSFRGFIEDRVGTSQCVVEASWGLEALHCFLIRQYSAKTRSSTSVTWSSAGGYGFFTSGSIPILSDTKREILDYQSEFFTRAIPINRNIGYIPNSGIYITSSDDITFAYDNSADYLSNTFSASDSSNINFVNNTSPASSNIFKNKKINSKVKTIPRLDYSGVFATIFPPIPGAGAIIQSRWLGGSSNLSNVISSRHIVKSISGTKKSHILFYLQRQ